MNFTRDRRTGYSDIYISHVLPTLPQKERCRHQEEYDPFSPLTRICQMCGTEAGGPELNKFSYFVTEYNYLLA